MSFVRVTVTQDTVGPLLADVRAFVADLRDIYAAIGAKLESNINLRFDTKTAPSGEVWKPWAPSTAAARAKEGRGTLLEYTGRMRDSLTHLANSQGGEVGFGVDYAQFHEGNRPMLLDKGHLSQDDVAYIAAVVQSLMQKKLAL